MTPGVATKVIAASFALCAFATATVVGLWIDNPAQTILARALGCMLICQLVGMIVGMIAEHAAAESIAQYQKANAVDGKRAPGGARPRSTSDEVLEV